MDARLSQGDRRSRVTVAVDIISRWSNSLLPPESLVVVNHAWWSTGSFQDSPERFIWRY